MGSAATRMPSLRTKQMRLLALLALPITWFILLSGRWTRSPAADVVSMANYYSHPLTTTSKERFVRAIMDKPVLHKFDPTEIQAYCSKQTWPEDLVLECHGIIGGIGSVRQQIFTCVRWAMATGTAILIPRPHPRRQTTCLVKKCIINTPQTSNLNISSIPKVLRRLCIPCVHK